LWSRELVLVPSLEKLLKPLPGVHAVVLNVPAVACSRANAAIAYSPDRDTLLLVAAVIEVIVVDEDPDAYVPVVSAGKTWLTPDSSNRVQPTRVVPEVVTVTLGAVSEPAATFQNIPAQACGVVAVFPDAGPALHPDGADGAVTLVVAAAVITMTSRSPAVRGWVPDHVLVAVFAPLTVVYAVAVGVPTAATVMGSPPG
jgi:hypothetical protein